MSIFVFKHHEKFTKSLHNRKLTLHNSSVSSICFTGKQMGSMNITVSSDLDPTTKYLPSSVIFFLVFIKGDLGSMLVFDREGQMLMEIYNI